ncbi:MAG: 30S ribosomal protein S1 [Syntrophus sp. (in: bacteria)]|nr:30S ribosomal protein S1 [Syntrophus sp. (in: bacteria)]
MSEANVENSIQNLDSIDQESEKEEQFSELFEKSNTLSKRLDPGQKIKARVVSISGDFAYVDLGGKSEGVIDINEFMDENSTCAIKVDDEVEVFFVSVQNGLKKLTTLVRGLSTVSLAGIRDAYEAGLPVSGKVTSELKGGFEVHVGKARCFCPFSQIDLRGSRDAGAYLHETFPFKVLEYEEDGRNIILSRRALLEEERQVQLDALKKSLEVGMEVSAKVRSIQNFGVFVDIGGMDGLIPMSEVTWDRSEKVENILSIGQEVTVKIISLDWTRDRLTLSLKSMQADPWTTVAERYPADTEVRGTIVRLAPFGVFVSLEPGIDGLIHVSKLGAGRRIKHPQEVVEVGQMVDVCVIEVDPKNKKISLSMEQKNQQERPPLPAMGEIFQGVVERVMPYGIFLKTESGVTGLIPNSEMGTPRGTNHSRLFPEGTPMQVIVTAVDEGKGKVTFSRSGVEEKTAENEYNQYKDKVKKEETTASGLGSLGELIMAKFGEKVK